MPICKLPTPRRNALAHATATALLFASCAAQAQVQPAAQSPSELDRILVTAQKREQQVQDVPIAITAYSGEFLQRYDLTDFSDIGNFIPGLEVQEQSPNNPGFVIRGITSDSGEANVEPRVSVFQDGVSISKSRGSVVQPFDLERVEVLRGPQGTLFGRGAQTGAVHLIQNKASDVPSSSFSIGAGNYNSMLFTGHANQTLGENLYGRVAVYAEKRDGTIENLSGGDLNGKDTMALRASLRMDVGDQSRLDLIVNLQKDNPPGTDFRSGTIPNRQGSTDVYGPADLNRGDQLGLDRTVRGVTLLGSFPLSDSWTLSTISGWRDFDSMEEFDADGSQLYALEFAEHAKGTQASQEFRFDFDGGGSFRGFTGLSWFHEDGSQRVPFSTNERSFITLPALGLGIPPLLPDGTPNTLVTGLPVAPGVVLPLKPFHQEQYSNFGTTTAVEIFADGTWSLTDRLDLTLGLRGTYEDVKAGYQADFFGVPSALGLLGLGGSTSNPNILFLPTNGRLESSDSFTSAVGRAVAAYRFSDTLSGYVSAARGRRPDVISVDAFGTEIIDAEIVQSYEIGLKGNLFEGRLLYDLAAYYYDYSNFQTTVQDPDTTLFVPANGGNAHASGAELSLMYQLGDRFGAFFNYGFSDASFNAVDDDGNPQQLAGNRFRLNPEHSASAGFDFSMPVGNGAAFYLRPSWNWRSQVFFEDQNTPGIEQAGYALYNLRAGVRFGTKQRWDLSAHVDNATDKQYLIDAGNTGRLFGTPTFIPGNPRLYGVRLSGRF
ncbi:TonB-dependent receptor [Pseudoxanthomonas wuyuanensis]